MSPVPEEDHDKHDGDDIENIEAPNLVIPAEIENSDEEEEEDGGHGYQLLPQGADDENGNVPFTVDSDEDSGMSDGDAEETESEHVDMATGLVPSGLYPNFPEGDLPSYLQVPDLPRTEKKDMLWNQPRSANSDVMDSGQIASIKNAMKGFDLPVCNIPDWARHVSEDKWKEQLLARLSPNKSHLDRPTACSAETSQSSESSLSEAEKDAG